MVTAGLNLQAPTQTHYGMQIQWDTTMTRLANDPVTWMPMMGIAAFIAVHGALLIMLLRAG